jgi:hypothetical protein
MGPMYFAATGSAVPAKLYYPPAFAFALLARSFRQGKNREQTGSSLASLGRGGVRIAVES